MRDIEAPQSSEAATAKGAAQSNGATTSGVLLTADEYKSHLEELSRLRDLRNRELPRRLRDARSFVGADAAEEIAQIGNEQDVVTARIARLSELLRGARIVSDQVPSDVVSVGHAVEVEYVANGRVITYQVAGAGFSVESGGLSARSPVGLALMGRRAGDTVAVELPNGRLETLRILSVRRSPRAAA